ncbi:S8 family serine peptidase [Cellulomonas composti]|uniref:Peptidase S8/S53 domain-containing protein n=1 Tax=Cellulomonas composti TaxID=266130 RepID=A0A511JF07_9CELL|nr:S8 family serine peptidase [Cellulomonas composti]GEL96323.1 hypothetical protein CCO02nite_29810 [Cellulomonas composti]
MSRVGRAVAGALATVCGVTLLVTPAIAPGARAADAVACSDGPATLTLERPPALAQLSAAQAWQVATGARVVVAVVDSGVDATSPHLTDAVLPGVDLVGLDADTTGQADALGHGTALAGAIAARKIRGSGVVGLARDAKVLPVRVFYDEGDRAKDEGVAPTPARIAEGIRWAVDHGAQVVNVSMSTLEDSANLRGAVEHAAQEGVLVVASAGNRETADDKGDGPRYPAAYPGVLGVAAVDRDLAPTDASIRGPQVDVAAPGQDVVSAYPGGGDCVLASDTPSSSFATAYVSAAAALLAERYPDEDPQQWTYRLEATAARPGADTRDDSIGWGVIRPDAALAFVDDGTAPGPTSPTHPRADTAPVDLGSVAVVEDVDPLAGASSSSAWWLLVAAAAVTSCSLAWRLVRPARARARAGARGPVPR